MDFIKFKEEANAIVKFYAVTPPNNLLEMGSVFSSLISFTNVKLALLRDLEKLLNEHMTEKDREELSSWELVDFVEKVVKDFRKRYYEE